MVTIELIEQLVCEKENVDPDDLHKKTRKDPLCTIRQMIMMFAVEFGHREIDASKYFELDRCTAINARKSIRDRYDTDKRFREKIDRYEKLIENVPELMDTYANILARLKKEASDLNYKLSILKI